MKQHAIRVVRINAEAKVLEGPTDAPFNITGRELKQILGVCTTDDLFLMGIVEDDRSVIYLVPNDEVTTVLHGQRYFSDPA